MTLYNRVCGSVRVRSRCAGAFVLVERAARVGRSRRRGLGIGSVWRGGSACPSETRSVSWPFSRRAALSELLKIRVSMVDGLGLSLALALWACCACPNSLPANLSVPGRHFQLLEFHAVSEMTGGLSGAEWGVFEPTIGLLEIGSIRRRRWAQKPGRRRQAALFDARPTARLSAARRQFQTTQKLWEARVGP